MIGSTFEVRFAAAFSMKRYVYVDFNFYSCAVKLFLLEFQFCFKENHLKRYGLNYTSLLRYRLVECFTAKPGLKRLIPSQMVASQVCRPNNFKIPPFLRSLPKIYFVAYYSFQFLWQKVCT